MSEIILNIVGIDPIALYGEKDIRLNLIRKAFPEISIISRGNQIKLTGPKKDTQKAVNFHGGNHIADQDVKSYLSRIEGVLDQVKYLADTIIKLDKKLERTRGLQKKIQKNVDRFKKINQSTSLLLIAMQERISRVIGTSADGQKIDTYSEFFEKVRDCSCMLHDVTKKQRQK